MIRRLKGEGEHARHPLPSDAVYARSCCILGPATETHTRSRYVMANSRKSRLTTPQRPLG